MKKFLLLPLMILMLFTTSCDENSSKVIPEIVNEESIVILGCNYFGCTYDDCVDGSICLNGGIPPEAIIEGSCIEDQWELDAWMYDYTSVNCPIDGVQSYDNLTLVDISEHNTPSNPYYAQGRSGRFIYKMTKDWDKYADDATFNGGFALKASVKFRYVSGGNPFYKTGTNIFVFWREGNVRQYPESYCAITSVLNLDQHFGINGWYGPEVLYGAYPDFDDQTMATGCVDKFHDFQEDMISIVNTHATKTMLIEITIEKKAAGMEEQFYPKVFYIAVEPY